MVRFYVIIFFALTATGNCHAQVDTEFWFVAPDISSGHGDRPIYLRISTQDQAASVTVTLPANGNIILANLAISSNTTQTINLTSAIDLIETNQPARVMKTGIRIVASAPVTAYYEVGSQWNSDIFALKGRNALGNRFVIPGQNFYDNSQQYNPTPYSSFDVVATLNNTVVTVRPTRPIFGHVKDTVITVRLNAGETYSFRKVTTSANDNPVGTIVESSKPIAITLVDDSVINGTCRDMLGDQIVPVKVAGVEYVVQQGSLNSQEYIFITATEDNTKVFIGGSTQPQATLKTGQLFRHPITSKSTYILASKTIYVFHVTGFGCELGMAILPSINCKGSQQIGFNRSTSESFWLNILVPKEGIGLFTLNGSTTLIPVSAFSVVPGTNDKWYTAHLSYGTFDIPEGQASLIANSKNSFQVGIINGNAQTTCRYGYFSAFSTLFLGDDFKFCEGETATINAGLGKDSYLWSTGETTPQITIANSGTYWVKAIKEECTLYDTINVEARKGKEDIGPDRVICQGDTVKVDGKKNFSWAWSEGTTKQYLETTIPGKYWVSVFDEVGCQASDTILISWSVRPEFDNSIIILNEVSVDSVDESHVGVSWTTLPSAAVGDGSVFLYKRILNDEIWTLHSKFPLTADFIVDKDNLTDSQVYEYYASLSDRCFGELASSSVHNTIQLTGTVDTLKEVVSLRWNPYYGWSKGVENYEVWRKLDDSPGYKLLARLPGTDEGSFSTTASDGFNHQYIIRAIENNGQGESWSNNADFELKHPVYVPNVFTPNGDDRNEFFEITKIQLYKNSVLIVFNRWGNKVFAARNYENNWAGAGLDSGVYYYVLDLKRGNKILKGPISILR